MTVTRYLLQARMSSSRLPGKSLLPIAGRPIAVLAAQRAARNGADLVVATSAAPSDDPLAEALRDAGLRVHRGPLEDVLRRFVEASADLPDQAIVVRLTADNLFPDADFIERLTAALAASGLDYLGTSSPRDGLPYGLSAEAFRLAALHAADSAATTPLDRGDVTPWIVRNRSGRVFDDLADEIDGPHLRCTIDMLSDYVTLNRVFAGIDDPVGVGHRTLCERLAALPDSPRFRVPFAMRDDEPQGELVLGTAQLGQAYGIANRAALISSEGAAAMVRRALAHGVTHIDTGAMYGEAEARIGRALADGWHSRAKVITKVTPPRPERRDLDREAQRALAEAQVLASCRALGTPLLDTVLLHEAWPLERDGNPFWQRLLELRAEGVIARLGLSAQSPAEVERALALPEIEHLQLPVNLLDRRWEESGFVARLASRQDLVVHARSAFLQGLLACDEPELWRRLGAPEEILTGLRHLVGALGRESLADLCLAYLRAQDWLDGIVIGMATPEELEANLRLFLKPPLSPEACARLREELPRAPDWLLDPGHWPALATGT